MTNRELNVSLAQIGFYVVQEAQAREAQLNAANEYDAKRFKRRALQAKRMVQCYLTLLKNEGTTVPENHFSNLAE